ncbi:MAG: hypothetical protein LBB26_04610 [Puniceicoccales bacterium]|nr:hypothetical protein [Puniceicoccales bacterium]
MSLPVTNPYEKYCNLHERIWRENEVQECVLALQQSEVIWKTSDGLGFSEKAVTYKGRKINIKSITLVELEKEIIPKLLQDMNWSYGTGKFYSCDGNLFMKEFSEYLVCFLACFAVWLGISGQSSKDGETSFASSIVQEALKWLNSRQILLNVAERRSMLASEIYLNPFFLGLCCLPGATLCRRGSIPFQILG